MDDRGFLLDILTLTSCISPHHSGVKIHEEVLKIVNEKLSEVEKKRGRIILGKIQCRKYLRSLLKLLATSKTIYTSLHLLSDISDKVCLSSCKEEINGKWHKDEYDELRCLALEYLKDCRIDSLLTCKGKYSVVNDDLIKKLRRYSIDLEHEIVIEGGGTIEIVMYSKSVSK